MVRDAVHAIGLQDLQEWERVITDDRSKSSDRRLRIIGSESSGSGNTNPRKMYPRKAMTHREAKDVLRQCQKLRESIDRLCKEAESALRRNQLKVVK